MKFTIGFVTGATLGVLGFGWVIGRAAEKGYITVTEKGRTTGHWDLK